MNPIRTLCFVAVLCFGFVSCGTPSEPLVQVKSFHLECNAELVQKIARDQLTVDCELRPQRKKYTLWTDAGSVRAVTGLVEQLRLEDRMLAEPTPLDRATKSPAEVEQDRLQRLGRDLATELVGAAVLNARITLSSAETGRLGSPQASRIVAADVELVLSVRDEELVRECHDKLLRRLGLEKTPDHDPIHINCILVAWNELKAMLPAAATQAASSHEDPAGPVASVVGVDPGMLSAQVSSGVAPVRPFLWTIYAIAVVSLIGNVGFSYLWWRARRVGAVPRAIPAPVPTNGKGA